MGEHFEKDGKRRYISLVNRDRERIRIEFVCQMAWINAIKKYFQDTRAARFCGINDQVATFRLLGAFVEDVTEYFEGTQRGGVVDRVMTMDTPLGKSRLSRNQEEEALKRIRIRIRCRANVREGQVFAREVGGPIPKTRHRIDR
jgi:hypothetical protein